MKSRLKKLFDAGNWMLRSSNGGVGHSGWKRKAVGHWNEAGDYWTGEADCATCGGFFGITPATNRFGLLWSRRNIELCEWRGECVVIAGDKVCVSAFRAVSLDAAIPAEFFEACGMRLAVDGAVVSPVAGECWIAIAGHCMVSHQSGGWFSGYDQSTQTVQNQSGGLFYANAQSAQTVK